jgi:hypothetical protein
VFIAAIFTVAKGGGHPNTHECMAEQNMVYSQAPWLTSLILAIQEAEIKKIEVRGQSGQSL